MKRESDVLRMPFRLILPLAMTLLLTTACRSDDDELKREALPFNMEREAEIIEGLTQRQAIYSGNGTYTLNIADASIVSAEYVPSASGFDYGGIVVKGLKKGKTTITVTDTKVQRSVDIAVKVISSNFYMMSMAQSRHPSLKPDLVSCFIPSDKEQRDVLFFVQKGGGLLFFTRGTYSTMTEGDADYVVMRYPCSSEDNTMSDAEGAVMTEHKFLLKGSSRDALDILQARGPLTGRFTDPGQLIPVHLAEVGLPYEMEANIKFGPFYTLPIPFGYLE
ncbi:MAG: Ig-like domain-containing protein [Prevotella sp.]|nr:Ig-like domain-containing protein [Prevotella sp.]